MEPREEHIELSQIPRRALGRLKRMVHRTGERDFVEFSGTRLPPPSMRYCGAAFRDDETFLSSSDSEAERLVSDFGIGEGSRILEIGCGPGRLPIGLIRHAPGIESYHGFDLDAEAIDWCTRHITSSHPNYIFHTVEAQHDRYSPDGPVMDASFSLPVPAGHFHLVYLYGVFANMLERDVKIYLNVFSRVLRPGGRVFLTAFAEEDVPPIAVNPENYALEALGPQHFVRYEKTHLLSLFEAAGFNVDRFDHGSELAGATAVHLTLR